MGIDVYMRWEDQSSAEYDAQITGFDVTAGRFGYLREAYHGGPYVTAWLVPEGFVLDGDYEDASGWVGTSEALMDQIAAAVGSERSGILSDFPKLAQSADGFPPFGYLVDWEVLKRPHPKYPEDEEMRAVIPAAVLRRRLPLCEALNERRYPGDAEDVNESYRAFVARYETLEAQGKRPGVYVSY